jgi:phosphoesterase RecJ-like protein
MHRTAKQIHNLISETNNVLLVAHQNPDGDTLGSVTAMSQMLKNMGKTHSIFCLHEVPTQYKFLPNAHLVSNDPKIWEKEYELIITCDASDMAYAGVDTFLEGKTNIPPVINFDHHASNKLFGNLNLVITTASSTTEVLFQYMTWNNIEIDADMATSLLNGLITDTGNFSNSGTSKHALSIGSTLIKKGARINQIRTHVITDKKINTFKLWGLVLSRLSKHEKHNITYTYITTQDLLDCNVDDEAASGISNLMNDLKEGKATFVLREREDGTYKVSTRTTRDDFDLSQVAVAFGGGGHKKAAGFSVPGPIDKALETIWKKLENLT